MSAALKRIQQYPNDQAKAPDATHFRPGDRWVSPRGATFVVLQRVGEKVSMRLIDGGRKQWRAWDGIGGGWVRKWWGGAA